METSTTLTSHDEAQQDEEVGSSSINPPGNGSDTANYELLPEDEYEHEHDGTNEEVVMDPPCYYHHPLHLRILVVVLGIIAGIIGVFTALISFEPWVYATDPQVQVLLVMTSTKILVGMLISFDGIGLMLACAQFASDHDPEKDIMFIGRTVSDFVTYGITCIFVHIPINVTLTLLDIMTGLDIHMDDISSPWFMVDLCMRIFLPLCFAWRILKHYDRLPDITSLVTGGGLCMKVFLGIGCVLVIFMLSDFFYCVILDYC